MHWVIKLERLTSEKLGFERFSRYRNLVTDFTSKNLVLYIVPFTLLVTVELVLTSCIY